MAILESIDRKPLGDQSRSQNFATVDEAARRAGFGNRETARQARTVVNLGTRELVEAMDSGEVSISAAANRPLISDGNSPTSATRSLSGQQPAAVHPHRRAQGHRDADVAATTTRINVVFEERPRAPTRIHIATQSEEKAGGTIR